MFNELSSIYLRQDSIYTGTASINVNIKSDWTEILKYQQLMINPQEQFQIRVPDQPRIVYSGGVGALMIEPYSTSICPPYISEDLRYTALIKKGSNRGLLYDYDTGISGDTLTNLTPQEDGEKYLDFITEGEILNETDTVIVKIFTNDENIDTTEAVIFIYPNDIDVQIIPDVISQGDTARVVLKKRGVNGLEDFAPDKVFNVEIVQGLEYGLILDSLSNDTLINFSNISQGFKIIAKDSVGIDATKIRIKVSTEESGFPVAKMIRNNTKTNKKEIVDDNENLKSDDEKITPDWIVPGPILLEGFGDLIVKVDGCDDAPKCNKPIEYPKLKVVLSGNQDICNSKSSLKSYFTPYKEIYLPEILICFNSLTDRWQFKFGNENEIESGGLLDICPTNIQNMGEILIDDVHNFPSGYSCINAKNDIAKHYIYGGTKSGTFTLKSILMAHEEEHKRDFERLYEQYKEAYLSTAQLLLKPCKEFTDENAAKAYYEPIIRAYMKQIYMATYNDFDKLGGADGSYERLMYELRTNRKIYGFITGLIAIAEVIYCP